LLKTIKRTLSRSLGLLFFLLIPVWVKFQIYDPYRIEKRGVLAKARFINKHAFRAIGGEHYEVIFSFTPEGGAPIEAREEVREFVYGGLTWLNELEVLYLPEDPSIHRLTLDYRYYTSDRKRITLSLGVTALLLIWGLMLVKTKPPAPSERA
jgi:hypothetical protein